MKNTKKNKPTAHAAMASPLRMEIVGLMNDPEPLSISDMAARLGRPATSLYHHVEVLVEAGILISVGTRPKGKRFETIYRPTEKVVELEVDREDPTAVGNAQQAIAAALRMTRGDFDAAIANPEVPVEGPLRELIATRMHMRASDEILTEVNRRLDDFFEYLQGLDPSDLQPGPEDHFLSLTMVLAPLRGRRPTPEEGESS